MEGRDQASRRRVAASEASRNRRARRRPRRLRRNGVAGTSEGQHPHPPDRRHPMIEMTLGIAETALRAALDKAKALGTPMTVTVVDEAGRLVLCARGDGTGFFTPETSRAKAVAAAAFRRSTAELTTLGAKGWGFWQVMPIVAQGEVLPTLGGAQ